MRKDETKGIGKADPPILLRLATLNTNRGTWHGILGMHRYAIREMMRQDRKRGREGEREKKEKEGRERRGRQERGSGYFSHKETNALRARKFQSPPLRRKYKVDFSN